MDSCVCIQRNECLQIIIQIFVFDFEENNVRTVITFYRVFEISATICLKHIRRYKEKKKKYIYIYIYREREREREREKARKRWLEFNLNRMKVSELKIISVWILKNLRTEANLWS